VVEALKPLSLKDALEAAARQNSIIFAGGTDLMVKKKRWTGLEPDFNKPVILISELPELRGVRKEAGYLLIGAACTCSQIMENKLAPQLIKQIFSELASPAIRNTATIGGNICNASPAGDSLPILYALDAILCLESFSVKREVSIQEFIIGPGKTVLRDNEILTCIKVPIKEFQMESYKKIGTRKSTALSKVSFTGLAEISEGKLKDIRLAFGASAPTVVRNRRAEEEIIKMFGRGSVEFKNARDIYGKLLKPIDDQRSTRFYRKEVCLRLLGNFLTTVSDALRGDK
jgi:xanthine dehydrogenase FAD-binding subunit